MLCYSASYSRMRKWCAEKKKAVYYGPRGVRHQERGRVHICTAAVKYDPKSITLVIIFQNQICKVTSQPILKYYAQSFCKGCF